MPTLKNTRAATAARTVRPGTKLPSLIAVLTGNKGRRLQIPIRGPDQDLPAAAAFARNSRSDGFGIQRMEALPKRLD